MAVTEIVWKEQLSTLISSSDKLVFVDFWAEWCWPCRMLGPVLHDLAVKFPDSIEIAKVDVDVEENQALSMEYSVRSIPQVTIFKDWKQVDQFVWALPPDQVEAYIKKHAS